MDPPPGQCRPGPGDPQKRDKYPSCSSCLQEAGPGCGWCSELNTQGTEAERKLGRQSVESNHFFNSLYHAAAKGCVPESQCQPASFIYERATETSSGNQSLTGSDTVHIQPQSSTLTLRPSIKHNIR